MGYYSDIEDFETAIQHIFELEREIYRLKKEIKSQEKEIKDLTFQIVDLKASAKIPKFLQMAGGIV